LLVREDIRAHSSNISTFSQPCVLTPGLLDSGAHLGMETVLPPELLGNSISAPATAFDTDTEARRCDSHSQLCFSRSSNRHNNRWIMEPSQDERDKATLCHLFFRGFYRIWSSVAASATAYPLGRHALCAHTQMAVILIARQRCRLILLLRKGHN
jgi:hypothetical protein